jgi:CheY-like chemotaxis protein
VGFDVKTAVNGADAVALWRSFRPDLVWMDVRMPVLDGLAATRQIRTEEATSGRARTRVIALSASALDHERQQIAEAGSDDFLAKPFREEAVFDRMAEQLGLEYRYEGVDSPAPRVQDSLSPDRLRRLPPPLLMRLKESVEMGDDQLAAEIVREIRPHDALLADSLASALDSCQFELLLGVVEQT